MLASKGLPTLREAEKSDDGDGQQDQTAPERETKDDPGKAQEPEPGVSVQEAARLREDGGVRCSTCATRRSGTRDNIRDALWIPVDEVDARGGELPAASRIVTVCRSGKRSGKVAAQLHEKVYEADNIEGGMEAWHEAGLPMEPVDGCVA